MINWFKNTYFYLIFIYRPITSGVFSIPRLFANLMLYSILFVLIGIFFFFLSLINSEVLEINQLPTKSGIVKNISYNSKNSGGTLSLLLDNLDFNNFIATTAQKNAITTPKTPKNKGQRISPIKSNHLI